MDNIPLLIAFSAGLISFLSPCVLPLVPVYLANLAGVSLGEEVIGRRYLSPAMHSAAFVAGFTVVFIALGAAAGVLGFAVGSHLETLHRIAGGLLIFFGLYLLGTLKIGWLNYEKRLRLAAAGRTGYLRAFVIGAALSVGWTPCVGPILGGILTLASATETAWEGAYLLAAYSLGLGVPFIAASLAIGRMQSYLRRFNRYAPLASVAGGLLLIAVGALVFFDRLAWLVVVDANAFQGTTFARSLMYN